MKKELEQDGWGWGRVAVQSRPIPPGGQLTSGRTVTTSEVLPKEWGVWVSRQAPQPGVLHQEDESPECLALKASRAYFQKT